MAAKAKAGLTDEEKRIVKSLSNEGWRSQDIHAWINIGRRNTVNFGRISGARNDPNQKPAADDEISYFKLHRQAYDAQTGLNRYDDERLIRAREAMILAVQIFNSAGIKFKTEVFSILATVAWTYLMHEYYTRNTSTAVINEKGQSLSLSDIISRSDCPLSVGVKNNIKAIKTLRDKAEHHLLGKADLQWLGIFQACCLNFDHAICEMFGEKLTLANDLSFALQFSKMTFDHVLQINQHEIPSNIASVDALLTKDMTYDQINDIEFQFKVVYTLSSASKSKAHTQFIKPDSAAGKEIHNVLTKNVAADEMYPHKPGVVVKLVAAKTKKKFTQHTHQQALRKYCVRPKPKSPKPGATDKKYCIYHPAHTDYTYSEAWVEFLIAMMADEKECAAIQSYKLK